MEKVAMHTETEPQTKEERDVQVLAKLGKRPVLKAWKPLLYLVTLTNCEKRRFGFLPILGFMSTILITWEGSLM